jgi:hypothetical protein
MDHCNIERCDVARLRQFAELGQDLASFSLAAGGASARRPSPQHRDGIASFLGSQVCWRHAGSDVLICRHLHDGSGLRRFGNALVPFAESVANDG